MPEQLYGCISSLIINWNLPEGAKMDKSVMRGPVFCPHTDHRKHGGPGASLKKQTASNVIYQTADMKIYYWDN